jgi:hypothetical protein
MERLGKLLYYSISFFSFFQVWEPIGGLARDKQNIVRLPLHKDSHVYQYLIEYRPLDFIFPSIQVYIILLLVQYVHFEYLSDEYLINAVSEAVILSTLSYQEAWEMVISLLSGYFHWHLYD